MTTATFKSDDYLTWITVNAKRVLVNRITSLETTGRNQFTGIAQGLPFTIEGGQVRGGTSRDWFLDWDAIGSSIHCSSMVDAIKTIESS